MLHWIEAIVFFALLLLTIYGFFQPLYLRYKLVSAAQKENRYDNPFKRIKDAVFSFFFLLCSVKRERIFTGFVHIFILYGSLTFDTVSINHILEGFNENWNFFGHGMIRHIHSAWADSMGIMVLLAVFYFSVRRWVFRPKNYTFPSFESAKIYILLVTVTITFFTYEGAAVAFNSAQGYSAFAGKVVGEWMQALMPINLTTVKTWWWIHIVNVFIFVSYVPRSKYLHMFIGPINIAFKSYKSSGFLKPLEIDLETAEKFGLVDLEDMTWKDLLDSYACMECGRCDDYCPANQTGKPLSPKNIILDLKWQMLREKDVILGKKDGSPTPLMDGIYMADAIWACTTCGACMYVCPVKNEHIPKIVGTRQSETLMNSRFPAELNTFFKNMETNNNPWGFGAATRGDWAEDLDIKILSKDADVDILYWVGCAGAFDERSKKVTYSMIDILKAASVDFGVLGVEENCCGDQARRLGNEYVFQMLAQENIETFKRYNIKKILVTCPHGYNTFKNEYPALVKQLNIGDWDIEVVHHTEFIAQLTAEGKLKLDGQTNGPVTFHDPCYLGRHNDLFKAPREVLNQTGAQMKEMKNNRGHSLCCGAGGGLMWTEEHIGKRVNHLRTENALDAGTGTICTSCPFCMTMLSDGVKDKGKEEGVQVKDIAEITAESLSAKE
jgi:Fe-S oxidoreductase